MSFKSFAQNKTHIITYQVGIIPVDIEKNLKKLGKGTKDKALIARLDKLFNSNVTVDYKLICNQNESAFFKEKQLEKEFSKSTLIDAFLGDAYYYSNLKNNEILKKTNSFDKVQIVKYNLTEWEITNDKKKVKNYNCKKAIGTYIVNNKNGAIKMKVTAWFTPEIPIVFAPAVYSGLPGLVLELQDNKLQYKVKKIALNQKKIKIKTPSGAKILSDEEYQKLIREASKDFKKILK